MDLPDKPAMPEKFLTVAEAAKALGIFPWKLDRAVRRGMVASYTPFNSRRLVRLSEVIAAIEASRHGGNDV